MAIRVLHLSGSKHFWSGNEQQLVDLIESFPEGAVENHIFCYEDSAIADYAKHHGIYYHPQKRLSQWSPALAKQLKRCVQEQHIDLLHCHTSNYLSLFTMSRRLCGLKAPLIFTRKAFIKAPNLLRHIKYNDKGITAYTTDAKAIQKDLQRHLKFKNWDKIHVIYDGINIDRDELGSREDLRTAYNISTKYLVGSIANHVDDKDLPTLIRTFDYLKNELHRDDVSLVQMGAFTECTDQLKAMISDLGLEDTVILLGQTPNAKEFMPQFDALIMTSQQEALPLTVYEAYYYRTPLVTTNAGGIPELVTDGVTGLMSDVGDYKDLANKLNLLLQDNYTEARSQMIEHAHNVMVNNYTSRSSAKQMLQLYRAVIVK